MIANLKKKKTFKYLLFIINNLLFLCNFNYENVFCFVKKKKFRGKKNAEEEEKDEGTQINK